jgi:putative spermidine/putrescine transport system ATP-binding protein
MDEPLSNLDAKLRLEMRSEIRRIHQLIGSATIYVTHDQDEALSLADRIVVLRDGQVRQIGTPHELYGAPASADVAEFMGYRNILPAILRSQDGRIEIEGASLAANTAHAVPAGRALAAIRPEDLTPQTDAPIAAKVETAEYRGRDFYGTARTPGGTELFFRAETRLAPGELIRLGAQAERILVYPE